MSANILTRPIASHGERIAYDTGPHRFGDLRVPPGGGPHPVVLSIHGGYWRAQHDLSYMGHICEALRAAGLATWNIEYRRIGHDGGAYPGSFQDVAAAADFVRVLAPRYDLDLARVVALGHSAGGQFACWLAARHNIPHAHILHSPDPLGLRAVVSLAGVLDLRWGWQLRLSSGVIEEFLGGRPDAVPARYAAASPYDLLPLGVPQTVIHGTADVNVPFEISQRYADAASAAGDDVELLPLRGAGHFEIVDPATPQWLTVLDALRRMDGNVND